MAIKARSCIAHAQHVCAQVTSWLAELGRLLQEVVYFANPRKQLRYLVLHVGHKGGRSFKRGRAWCIDNRTVACTVALVGDVFPFS